MLAQDFTNFTFRELVERRNWSWLMKAGQFLVNNVYSTGNVNLTFNSNQVIGLGTGWTAALVNRQFRSGQASPIYTITAVNTVNQIITLDQQWGGITASGQGYQIYNVYLTVPSDFHSFISVYDPAFNWQLWWNVKQEELNLWDAQRSSTGTAYCVAQAGYDTTITPPLPKYELWPHQLAQKPFPFWYTTRPPDLNDTGASLPRYITGNLILEGALAKAARWPGPDREHVSPYFNLSLAQQHQAMFEKGVRDAECQDDEVFMQDVTYGQLAGWPWSPFPLGDASFIQAHAI